MNKSKILLIISIVFILGGVVRLMANQGIFITFQMEHLWKSEPFFIYNYRLLGGFIIWIGLILFVCSKDLIRFREIIAVSILALALLLVLSFTNGLDSTLGLRIFLVDSIFSLFLIIVFTSF